MTQTEQHQDLGTRSAGRLMTERVPVIDISSTIAEAEAMLLKETKNLDTINYVYALGGDKKLAGAISVKEIFRLPKATRVSDVMERELVTIRPHTDKWRAALLAIEHNLKEIPVVGAEGHLLGVIPYDVILNVLHEGHIEDSLRAVGVHAFKDPARDIINAPAAAYFKKRLPWLVVGLIGGLIAAFVVDFYESALKLQLILASFIPAIVYIADAVGTQTQTIFIRSMALEQRLDIFKYAEREIKVGLGIAASLSLIMGALAYIIWNSLALSAILGFSFIATILAAMLVAVLLPLFFKKLNIDPAIASGPFATIIRDILSLIIYFSIASVVLSSFAV